MAFVRSSKYRHIFGTAWKRDKCYDNIKITRSPHDTNMCAVNAKFIAVVLESQGGGAFLVAPLSKVGRFDINYPKVAGHKSNVLDIAWNPFNDNEIASCSEDCTVKLWDIPDGGLSDTLTEARIDLAWHQRKVGHVVWHPAAENTLASVGFDHKILIWNTVSGEVLFSLEGFHSDIIYSMSWNYNGSLIATTCKDKKLRILDPRKNELLAEGNSHQGTKPSRVVFCGTTNKLFTTGFSRMSERQYAVWNAEDISKPLSMENIDNGSGVLFPFFDDGTGCVFIAGKGDGQIKYFEVTDKPPYCHFLSMYQHKDPQRGVGCMPKRELKFMECEVMRFYKLHNKNLVEPISMTVPRKSEMFQDDIYPPCFSGVAALSAEEWASGVDKDPLLLEFSSSGLSGIGADKCQRSSPLVVKKQPPPAKKEQPPPAKKEQPPPARKTEPPVRQQSWSSNEGPEPKTLEEYKKACRVLRQENTRLYRKLYRELKEENEQLKKQLEQIQAGK